MIRNASEIIKQVPINYLENWKRYSCQYLITFLSWLFDYVCGQMWACARGHVDCALYLYQWSSEVAKLCNKAGQSASNVARDNGHLHLADHLDSLEQDTIMQTDAAQ